MTGSGTAWSAAARRSSAICQAAKFDTPHAAISPVANSVRVGNADLAGQDDLVPAAAEQVGEHGFAAAGSVAVGGVDAVAAGGQEVLDHVTGGTCVGAVAERHGAQDDRCER